MCQILDLKYHNDPKPFLRWYKQIKPKKKRAEFIPKVLLLNFQSMFAQAPVAPDLIPISIEYLNNMLVNLVLSRIRFPNVHFW